MIWDITLTESFSNWKHLLVGAFAILEVETSSLNTGNIWILFSEDYLVLVSSFLFTLVFLGFFYCPDHYSVPEYSDFNRFPFFPQKMETPSLSDKK